MGAGPPAAPAGRRLPFDCRPAACGKADDRLAHFVSFLPSFVVMNQLRRPRLRRRKQRHGAGSSCSTPPTSRDRAERNQPLVKNNRSVSPLSQARAHTSRVPSQGRLARPANRSGGGSGRSGRDPEPGRCISGRSLGDAKSGDAESSGSGAGRSTRTGPGGRSPAVPRPRRAEGELDKSESRPRAQSKTVHAERWSFAETHNPTVSGRRPGAPPQPPVSQPARDEALYNAKFL